MWMFSVLSLLCVAVLARERTALDDYINTCKDDKNHNFKPVPAQALTAECAPWKDKACCNGNTQNRWVNLNWDQCSEGKMSEKCKTHFRQDNCLYYCSPNLGPWIVKVTSRFRTERFMHLPVCQTECDAWWNDCKNDYSCTDNWLSGFTWKSSADNTCKKKECKKFQDYYSNAKSFCEGIYPGSYSVVPDTSPCMLLNFTGTNPNTAVSKCHAERIVNQANAQHHPPLLLLSSLAIYTLLF